MRTGTWWLVHQLIRQYVMARILVDLVGYEKKVVPFAVGGSRRQEQVGFMLHKGWMEESNLLSWSDVEALTL